MSTSFRVGEFSSEASYDFQFTHDGIVRFASSDDTGERTIVTAFGRTQGPAGK